MLSSNSVTCQPGWATDVVRSLPRRRRARGPPPASGTDAVNVYPATKAALARWVRREAVEAEWTGAGVRAQRRRARAWSPPR